MRDRRAPIGPATPARVIVAALTSIQPVPVVGRRAWAPSWPGGTKPAAETFTISRRQADAIAEAARRLAELQ